MAITIPAATNLRTSRPYVTARPGVVGSVANISVNLSGFAATASSGAVAVTGKARITPTQGAAASAAGFATVQAKARVTVSGVSATGGVGISGAKSGALAAVTQAALASGQGAVVAAVKVSVALTGFGTTAASQAVSVTVGAGAALTGFGPYVYLGTPSFKLGAGVSLTLPGLTGSVGSEGTLVTMRVSVPGFEGDAALGTETAEADANAPISGFGLTASLGELSFKLGAGALASQAALLGELGALQVGPVTHVYITGALGAAASVGDVAPSGKATASMSGFGLAAAVGNVATIAAARVSPQGFAATAGVGNTSFLVGMRLELPAGVGMTAGQGAEAVQARGVAALAGLLGTAGQGLLSGGGTSRAEPSGFEADAILGAPVIHGESVVTLPGFEGDTLMGLAHQETAVTVSIAGFGAQASSGALSLAIGMQAYPYGVAAYASAGSAMTNVPIRQELTGHQLVASSHAVNVNIGIGKYFIWANDLYVASQSIPKPALHQNHHVEGFDIDWVSPEIGLPRLNGLIGLLAADLTVGSPQITFEETNWRMRGLTLTPARPQLGRPRLRQFGPIPAAARDLVVKRPKLGTPKLRTRKRVPPRGPKQQPYPGSSLLYRGATALERSMADADAERLVDCEAEAILDVWNPATIAWNNLPFLAWGMSVNLWEPGWPTDVKREWTSRQWTFKELRGKESGIRMALDFAGRGFTESGGGYDLKQVVAPPQGFFASRDMTKTEWDDWIHLMPELRIKLAHGSGEADPDEWFADDEFGRFSGGFVGASFIGLDDGPVMYGRRAVLRWKGIDIPMQMTTTEKITYEGKVVEVERVSVLGHARDAYFIDLDFIGEKFVCADQQAPKLYTWRLEKGYDHSSTLLGLSMVMPDMVVMDPRYERDSDVGYGDNLLFADDWFVGYYGWLEREYAADMLADRVFLYDESVAVPMTIGTSFVGVDRIGMPPYHAELMIDLRTKERLPGHFVDSEDSFLGEVFVLPEDPNHIDRACRAVVAAKSLRDKIAVDFATLRQIEPFDPITESTTAADFVRASL